MKKLLTAFLLGVIVFAVGCSDSDNPSPAEYKDYAALLSNYSNNVVLTTYADLKTRAETMQAAVAAFNNEPSNQALLDAAATAWINTRVPWERSEAFLFGPASFMNLDPSLDSWPVDEQQLAEVLASNFELSADFVATGLGATLRGFHTIEYLLFRQGMPRAANEVTERERQYLIAVCQVLVNDATTLWQAWDQGFADEFAAAGEAGSRYSSQHAALQEALDGMIGICDEVANGKIADPFDEQNPLLVESQFSWNSIPDFQDNIRGVENTYLGRYDNSQNQQSFHSELLQSHAALDTRVQNEITAAIESIGQIPRPFRNNLGASEQIIAAQTAITTLMNTLSNEVKPIFIQ